MSQIRECHECHTTGNAQFYSDHDGNYYVKCSCGMTGKKYPSSEEAIDNWNQHA